MFLWQRFAHHPILRGGVFIALEVELEHARALAFHPPSQALIYYALELSTTGLPTLGYLDLTTTFDRSLSHSYRRFLLVRIELKITHGRFQE